MYRKAATFFRICFHLQENESMILYRLRRLCINSGNWRGTGRVANHRLFWRTSLQPNCSQCNLRVTEVILKSLAMSVKFVWNRSAYSVSIKTQLIRRSFSLDASFFACELKNMDENFWRRMLGNLWRFAEETPSIECRSLNFIR